MSQTTSGAEGALPVHPLLDAMSRAVTWVVLRPMRMLPLATPSLAGLSFERIRLESQGASLAAWHVPCPGSRRGIVLCHGHNNCRTQLFPLFRPLHEAGFHVLSFDFRSMGVSGGQHCTYGYRERADVHAALRWLRTQAGVTHTGLLGYSMGGATALLTAAEDDDVRAVVTECAFARLEEMVRQRFYFMPPALRDPLGDGVRRWSEAATGFSAMDVDPEAAVRDWTPRPLLVIHAERDLLVPPDHGRRLARAAGAQGELWMVPHAWHVGCRQVARRTYTTRVVEFLSRHVTG